MADAPTNNKIQMTSQERRSSISLASIYALRMFGLFLILPVFAVYAKALPGGDNAFFVGLTIGIYGLTQSLCQIPFGMASDRFGRKKVILVGLAIFALGSFIAATSGTLWGVMLGRALQGAGAISAAISALIADSVREEVLTRSMGMVGASIGLTFALSLVVAPPLTHQFGVHGLFALTGFLALVAMGVIRFIVPNPKNHWIAIGTQPRPAIRALLADRQLMRLNLGIFTLHATQMALFMVVPGRLVSMGLPVEEHWTIYLPAVLIGFALMVKPIIWAERQRKTVKLMQISAGILVLTFFLFTYLMHSIWEIAFLLGLFFLGFNLLEATLPSLTSRSAPIAAKGTALGIYNTTQSLGLFTGGAVGGLLSQHFPAESVFFVAGFAMLTWLAVARGLHEARPASVTK